MKSFRCTICGYIHVGDTPPENCPICGASAAEFEPYEDPIFPAPDKADAGKERALSFRCINCGYIHDGLTPPATCPVCGMKEDSFEPHARPAPSGSTNANLRIVIIGGGIAGLSAAEEMRKHAPDASITLVSGEAHLPYYRLNLTRYLAGEAERALLPIYPEQWYQDNRIDLMLNVEVTEIDRNGKVVLLSNGMRVAYDRLLIAMGAHPFIPPVPGTQLVNVRTVRRLEDADTILEQAKAARTCICIGGGVLGLETAGALARHGMEVTLLEGSDWLMPRQLNRKGASLLKDFLQGIGITVRENSRTAEIKGETACEGVLLQTGEVLPADLVIITTGVRPNTYLSRKAGLEVDKGLVVDQYLCTSQPDIFAAGDVTEHHGTLYGLWNVAQYQGKVAALNVLGMPTPFGGIPRSNTLKVLGLEMFSIGEFSPSDASYQQVEWEAENQYVSLVLRDGRMVGGIVIGDKALALQVKHAVEKDVRFPSGHDHAYEDILRILREST